LRNKIPELQDALNGRLRQHHREMIRFCWEHIEYLERQLANLEARIDQALAPYQEEVKLLKSLSIIKDDTAAIIISELGPNMDVFPSEKHISSWAGLSPGNNESAGKKKVVKPFMETGL
jgi:transposase